MSRSHADYIQLDFKPYRSLANTDLDKMQLYYQIQTPFRRHMNSISGTNKGARPLGSGFFGIFCRRFLYKKSHESSFSNQTKIYNFVPLTPNG